MTLFVGRFRELRTLDAFWQEAASVESSATAESVASTPARGRCVLVTGPPAVGKTRLIAEFLNRVQAPSVFHAMGATALPAAAADGAADATGGAALFLDDVDASPLRSQQPDQPGGSGGRPDWAAALTAVAQSAAGLGRPAAVVVDNADALTVEAADALHRGWAAALANRAVLLVIIGRSLPTVGAAFRGDAAVLTVAPFNPAEVGQVLGLGPVDAFDAAIVSGGHADIAAQWPTGQPALAAIESMLRRSPSVFELRAEIELARGLGLGSQTATVLGAVGAEECSRASIGRRSGLPAASLDRALKHGIAAGAVVCDRPRSLSPSREARYRLADPYLRLWMTMIAPRREDIARGRLDAVVAAVRQEWDRWRRRVMLTLARGAMDLLAASGRLPGTGAVGGFWNRFEDVRVDLVGTDRDDDAEAVTFVGAVKWDAAAPFDHFDLGSLIAVRRQVPGVTDATPLVAVSLAGSVVGDAVAAVLGPAELLTAWSV